MCGIKVRMYIKAVPVAALLLLRKNVEHINVNVIRLDE